MKENAIQDNAAQSVYHRIANRDELMTIPGPITKTMKEKNQSTILNS